MSPKPDDIEKIFNAAIEKKSDKERSAYLDGACHNNPDLRSRVEKLIKAHKAAGSFLHESLTITASTLDTPPNIEQPGMVIGRYKLLQQIGEGGFGVVYMAEQRHPIRRRVALKIIKLGMDTKQVVARFEAERQALAMMDHPNIAKVFDAGATDTGRPYFVMELVKGISITEYCDKNNLNTRQRLEIFIDICKAVQHAHQKGIIHRDIKPSNVLITLRDDDSPVPKVIDFGIAKATQARLTEKTLFTELRQFIGTPEYMSPEQARMGELDIDTRCDIYSLGVLLYELLTGTTPFDAQTLREAGYNEIQRIISEDEPPKPSTRLSTLGDSLSDVAKHRNSEPKQLQRTIRGELDWIVLKALEKDRTRRYETANGLAGDVQRYLCDEPVVAGPPSKVYRLRKFVRRNQVPVMTAAAVAAVIVIGFIVSTLMYIQAEQARANESTARIEAVEAKHLAEKSEDAEKQQRHRAEKLLAEAHLDRGIKLINEGNSLGLLDILDACETAKEIPVLRESAARMWAIAHDLLSDRLLHVMDGARNLTFSPDGKLLATSSDNTAQLWNVQTGQPHGSPLQLEKTISAIVFSPDGKLLAAHSVEGAAQMWETVTGKPVGPILRHENRTTWYTRSALDSAVFSPDGKLLATGGVDGTVRLWDTKTGRTNGPPLQHNGQVWILAFSPNGKLLVSGSLGGSDISAKVWNVDTGKLHIPPLQHQQGLTKVAFSPDGKFVATASWDKTCTLWETDTGKIHKQSQYSNWITDIIFGSDGDAFGFRHSKETPVQLWETETNQKYIEALQHGDNTFLVAFDPDGRLFATGALDQRVRLWENADGQAYSRSLFNQGLLEKVEFSPDGKLLAVAAGQARIWRTFQPLDTEVVPYDDRFANVVYSEWRDHTNVVFDSDGNPVATADKGTVYLWDPANEQSVEFPTGGWVNSLICSLDGKLVAVSLADHTARVYDVETKQKIHTFKCIGDVLGIAFSHDGKTLATGTGEGVIQQWDLSTGKQCDMFPRLHKKVWPMAYSPEGDILATISDEKARTLRIWDITTDPPYRSLVVPAHIPTSKASLDLFDSDRSILINRLQDGNARVWRVPKAPTDLRMMQLRTWVALGVKKNLQKQVASIDWKQWQQYRQLLHSYKQQKDEKYNIPLKSEVDFQYAKPFLSEQQKEYKAKCLMFGDEHEVVLNAMEGLARAYESQGLYDQAEPLFFKKLQILRRIRGQEHPGTLWLMNNLALLYEKQGRYQEAEELHIKTLESRRRVLGEEHDQTLMSIENFGNLYSKQGLYDQALPLYRQVVEIKSRVLGAENLTTTNAMENIGWLYHKQGRFQEAVSVFRQILEIRSRSMGKEHPYTLWAMHNLTVVYQAEGNYKEAEPLAAQTLQIRRRVLGAKHPETLSSMEMLADISKKQGSQDQAEEHF